MRRALPRILALTVAAAATAAVLVPAPAMAAGNGNSEGNSQSPFVQAFEPTLVARATLSADHLEAGPAVGRAGHARERPHRPVGRPGDPRLLGRDRQRRRHVLGPARQRLRRQGATPPTSCCATTSCAPHWQTADGGDGAIAVERFISLQRPQPRARLPDRQRGHHRPPADRRRLRHRVGRAREGRHVLGRRGVRPVPAPLRRRRHAAREPVLVPGRASRRRTRTSQPGETPRVRAQPRLRGDGRHRRTAATSTRSSRAPTPTTPTCAAAEIHEFDTRRGAYTGRTWSYQTDQDGERHRRRLHGAATTCCCSSSATTSRATSR